jgi:ATP-dependent Lhr-like helicase
VVEAGGGRELAIESLPLEAESPAALFEYLASFRRRGWRKALAFCNTRAEVEAYATAARQTGSPFGEAVFVHYSNLERDRRREIEGQFAQAEAAICFASSTLELGIDIGDIDVVLLIGAPGSRSGFVQRLGRAGRRTQTARAACFYRTPLERLLFQALAEGQGDETPPPFRPSVAIQQIFSLLKQSPTAALRPSSLTALFEGMLTPADLHALLDHLRGSGYLTRKEIGEWRVGARLHRLFDLQGVDETALSLHSNIQNGAGRVEIREQQSQRLVASVDRQWFDRDVLTLEGRLLDVQWFDGEAMWVTSHRGDDLASPLHYLSSRQLLSFELAQQLPAAVGLAPGTAPLVAVEDGWLLFHWLGDIYGRALLDLLGFTLAARPTDQPGLAVLLAEPLRALSPLAPHQVARYLHDAYKQYESMLALGSYQSLLPPDLRLRSVVEQFDAPRFLAAAARLRVEAAAEGVGEELVGLFD